MICRSLLLEQSCMTRHDSRLYLSKMVVVDGKNWQGDFNDRQEPDIILLLLSANYNLKINL